MANAVFKHLNENIHLLLLLILETKYLSNMKQFANKAFKNKK